MAVPTHFKFVFRGIFENTEEEWSFSVKYRRDVQNFPDATVEDIDDAAVTAALTALMGASGVGAFSSSILATEWRAYAQGTDNRAEGDIKKVILGTPARGGTPNKYPSQISLCVTTVADDRGPGRLGRFYLPAPTGALTDFRLTTTIATNYAVVTTAFLKAVSDAIDLPNTTDSAPAVNISGLPVLTGTKQDIDHVEVGLVLDTIQTRRRQLVEERYEHTQIDW